MAKKTRTSSMLLRTTRELTPLIDTVLADVLPRLKGLFPDSDIQHIGATSIPKAVTKGDVDLVIRLHQGDFASSKQKLEAIFSVKQSENWTAEFASFGDDTSYVLPVGIQLVVKDSPLDIFVFLREYLLSNPEQLAAYNQLKTDHAHGQDSEYWKAKDTFFSSVLQSRALS